MKYYREKFPNSSVTPKMHMLERHIVTQTAKWGFGMGLLGEQGAESIHAKFNSMERAYSGIPNKKDRLLRVVQEHHLTIDPDNLVLLPTVKKRKLDEPSD